METQRLLTRTSEKWRRYPHDVLPLFVAEMDFELAPEIARALHDAVDRSDTGYAWPRHLRNIFARYAATAFDWKVEPERVFVVNDVMGGVAETLHALTHEGDGVAMMPPVYPPFFEIIRNAGRRVVEVPLALTGDVYAIDWDALERAFAGGTKALLFCHPHNPVGRVFDRAELERLAVLAQTYGALVISDEIHAPLVYPEHRHHPFAPIGQAHGADAVTLMSASKGWNIAGLKCAQMVAGSERVHEQFKRLPNDVRDRIGQFGIIATAAAYEHGAAWMEATLQQLDDNRRLVADLLAEKIPAIAYRIPDATYLAWLDCRTLALGNDPAAWFTAHAKVALAHGHDFGAPGAGFARLNFATSPAIITEAIDRIANALER